jgi:hypothetical protein
MYCTNIDFREAIEVGEEKAPDLDAVSTSCAVGERAAGRVRRRALPDSSRGRLVFEFIISLEISFLIDFMF